MTFGERVKQHREAQGLTQRELAEDVALDNTYLSRVENSRPGYLPGREMIELFVAALGLTQADADELHVLAGRIPADVEAALLANVKLMGLVRSKS